MELTHDQQVARREEMLALKTAGKTLAQIGQQYQVSRQRVAQILKNPVRPAGNPAQRPRGLEILRGRIERLNRLPAHDRRRDRIPGLESQLAEREAELAR